MQAYRLHRLCNPAVLMQVERTRLIKLLDPYRAFLTDSDVYIPAVDDLPLAIDYKSLAHVFSSPTDSTPPGLLEALVRIDGLATKEARDGFLGDPELRAEVGEKATAADIAVHVYLNDREELEKKRAEASLRRPRSFDYYLAKTTGGLDRVDDPIALEALQAALDRWFRGHKHGRGCRVLVYPDEGEVWFHVRHGGSFTCEDRLVDGESSSIFFHPEKYDVLVYDRDLGELRMNAHTKGERTLYRENFGLHLFGSTGHFPRSQKYTLEPLRSHGRDALVCNEIEGLQWINLSEIRYYWQRLGLTEVLKSEDLFRVLEARGQGISERAWLVHACFSVKFEDSDRPRSVRVRPPNVAIYQRDGSCELIERWLQLQGFIRSADS